MTSSQTRLSPMSGFISEWIDALRSGNYKQGVSFLRKGDEFCALGVACDLLKREFPPVIDQNGVYRYDGMLSELSSAIRLRIGLPSESFGKRIQLKNGKVVTSISEANDEGADFNEIADLIERLDSETIC